MADDPGLSGRAPRNHTGLCETREGKEATKQRSENVRCYAAGFDDRGRGPEPRSAGGL